MMKVIPWALPSINGGSSGGYTPQPEPTPEPTPEYYDFTDFQISFEPTYKSMGSYKGNTGSGTHRYEFWWYIYSRLVYSGVTVIDDSEVSSVIVNYTIEAGTVTDIGSNGSGTTISIDEKTKTVDIKSSIASGGNKRITIGSRATHSSSQNAPTPEPSFTGLGCIVNSVKVYNANGDLLQEWTP